MTPWATSSLQLMKLTRQVLRKYRNLEKVMSYISENRQERQQQELEQQQQLEPEQEAQHEQAVQ